MNQDGKTAGLTLPNPVSQANLMRLVYQNAGIDPVDTAYVEAHGTGTQAGKYGNQTLSFTPRPNTNLLERIDTKAKARR